MLTCKIRSLVMLSGLNSIDTHLFPVSLSYYCEIRLKHPKFVQAHPSVREAGDAGYKSAQEKCYKNCRFFLS